MTAANLDPVLVWATLTPMEQSVLARWLADIGFEPTDWPHVPPLRTLLPILAALRLSTGMPDLSAGDALREAALMLGAVDDDDRDSAHAPGDGFARTLRRWDRQVLEARGQSVRSRSEDAA